MGVKCFVLGAFRFDQSQAFQFAPGVGTDGRVGEDGAPPVQGDDGQGGYGVAADGLGAPGADAGFNGAPYFAGVQHAAAVFVGDERVFFTVRRKEVTP